MEFNQTTGNLDYNTINVPLFPVEKLKSRKVQHSDSKEEFVIHSRVLRAILVSDPNPIGSINLQLKGCILNPENNETEEFIVSGDHNKFSNDNISVEFKDFEG